MSGISTEWIAASGQVIQALIPLLKPGGKICVLDYNHTLIQWQPAPPDSMREFYNQFLKWRAEAGMDNEIGDHVAEIFKNLNAQHIEVSDQHEYIEKGMEGFETHIGIWQKVAETRGNQLVADRYISEEERLKAIAEYAEWMKKEAVSMRLYLKAVHAGF